MIKKIKLSLFIAVLLFCISISLNAQFSRNSAINLVLNTILAGDTVNVDVYASTGTLSGYVEFIDTDTTNCPYPGNWVFFVDDNPFSDWYHNCRYIFVNSQNGNYTTKPGNIYPKNLTNGFELISEADQPEPLAMTQGTLNGGLQPNDNYYAVIVCVDDNQANWNDVSLVYNTLIEKYGYKKENIFIHYGQDGTSNTTYENDLDGGDPSNDLDYPARRDDVHATFNELAGNTNNNNDIPALGPEHQLAVFFVNVPTYTPEGDMHLWLYWVYVEEGGYYYYVEDPQIIADFMAGINCAQMTLAFSINNGEGIADHFMDYSDPVDCKNRQVHVASGLLEDKHIEQYISGGNYGEYLYYWSAAARGVYPVTDYPWEPSQYETGSFPFEIISGFGDHPDDYVPDTDGDGYIQIEEAFLYADDQDTWSDYGYTNPYTPGQSEEPVNWDLLPFSEDLLTLAGLAGHVENTQTIENRNYLIGGDLDIDPEVTLTFDNGTGLYLANENAQINVSSGAVLNLGNNMEIFGGEPNRITVNGNIQIGTDVTFQKNGNGSNPFYGLVLSNSQMITNLDQVTFNEAQIHNYGAELNITGSVFNDCLFISSHSGNVSVSGSYCYNTEFNFEDQSGGLFSTATVINCTFISDNNYYLTAINIWNYKNFFLENNTVDNYYYGIQLWQSGAGFQGNQSIHNNEIFNCNVLGIETFNSIASISSNYLYNNLYGIRLINNSNVALYGNPGTNNYDEVNYITNNDSYEVYASTGSFPWYFRYNAIIDEDNDGNPTDPMVYWEAPPPPIPLKDVRYNCWGEEFVPAEDLYPGFMVYPVWECPDGGGKKSSEVALQTFLDGKEHFENEEYVDAEETFESVIELYPVTQYASPAMKELFALEKFTDNDYNMLKQYYTTNDSIQADTILTKLSVFLANKCEIEMENWQTAIDHFEDIIDNPETTEDSIFAIIDLGHTYFLMGDSTSRSIAQGKMLEHKPKSKEAFAEKRNYLLSLLPITKTQQEEADNMLETLKVGALLQNVPNPFSNTTTIYYKLNEQSSVLFKVYDHVGKEVSTISQSIKDEGINKIELDMSGLPTGIYFYSIFINGQLSDTKKMVVK